MRINRSTNAYERVEVSRNKRVKWTNRHDALERSQTKYKVCERRIMAEKA